MQENYQCSVLLASYHAFRSSHRPEFRRPDPGQCHLKLKQSDSVHRAAHISQTGTKPNQTKFQIINFRLNIINRLLGYQRYKTQFKFGPKELSFYQYIFLDFKLGIL